MSSMICYDRRSTLLHKTIDPSRVVSIRCLFLSNCLELFDGLPCSVNISSGSSVGVRGVPSEAVRPSNEY